MLGRRRSILALAVILAIFVVASVISRLRHGIDITDEAFYLAMPVDFARGDRPFVDELNITQTGAVLIYPFVKAYLLVARGTNGIFLYIRVLYLFFLAGVGWSAYTLASTRLPKAAALLLGVSCLCFMPYAIPGLSYNTLSAGLLTFGLCLTARGLITRTSSPPKLHHDLFLWAGVSHGAAAFAYPSVVVSTLPTAIAIFVLVGEARLRSVGRYVLGGCGFGLLISPVLLQAGAHQLRHVVSYSSQSVSSDPHQASILLDQFLAQHPQLWKSVAIIAVAVVFSRKNSRLVGFFLPFVPYLARGSLLPMGPITDNLNYMSCFALFAPLFALALRDRRVGRILLFGAWLPPLFAAAAMGWSSGNGVMASGLGMYPAAIVSAILLTLWLSEVANRWPSTWLRAAIALAPTIFAFEMLRTVTREDAFYREGGVRSTLTARITEGPYRGLYTTPYRKAWLTAVSEDIRANAHGDRALFYYDFPAGYLIANKRPLVASAWIFPIRTRSGDDASYFQRRAMSGNIVFHLDGRSEPSAVDTAVQERTDSLGHRSGGYTLSIVR